MECQPIPAPIHQCEIVRLGTDDMHMLDVDNHLETDDHSDKRPKQKAFCALSVAEHPRISYACSSHSNLETEQVVVESRIAPEAGSLINGFVSMPSNSPTDGPFDAGTACNNIKAPLNGPGPRQLHPPLKIKSFSKGGYQSVTYGELGQLITPKESFKDHPMISIRWEAQGFNAVPKWEQEPDIRSIIQVLKDKLGSDKQYEVQHIWDGAYNKFYSVDLEDCRYVMKLTLPVCPRTKTESEVATIRWTAATTTLRSLVPDIIAYDSSANNPIGCEWILMKRLEGVPLSTCWREVSLGCKERIVKALAKYAICVHLNQWKQIGSLYTAPLPCRGRRYQVGKITSMRLFWNRGRAIESDHGPFRTNREWVQRRLNVAHEQLRDHCSRMKDQSRKEQTLLWRMLSMSGVEARLWSLYDMLFPPPPPDEEPDDHEIVAIGRPRLVASPYTPPSTPKSTSSVISVDETEDEDDCALSLCSDETDAHGDNAYPMPRQAAFSILQSSMSDISLTSDYGTSQQPRIHNSMQPSQRTESNVQHATLPSPLVQRQANDISASKPTVEDQVPPETRFRARFEDWEPLRPNAGEHFQAIQDCDEEAEPTMLWHENLSADNILVDPETHRLTGILNWDCVSCIPVAVACDWPAFLHDGKHRTTEPEIEDYALWVPDNDDRNIERGRLRGSFAQAAPGSASIGLRRSGREQNNLTHHYRNHSFGQKQRGHIALRANYWRARRDFELTYLRKMFIQEMADRCPSWYTTWRQSKVRKDYEAAVQNCDNEHMIGKVEAWCEAVDVALQKGMDIKPPQVMSLHCDLFEGPDWRSWDDLDDLSAEWMKPIREHQRKVEKWQTDIDELHAARKALPNAKGTKTRVTRERTAADRALTKARQAVEESVKHLGELENLDEEEYDAEEIEVIRQLQRHKLSKATHALKKAEDKIASAERRGGNAEAKRQATEARYLAALEGIQSSEWYQKFDHERNFNRQTWKNLEKALVKEYGEKTWWKHRLEPLGEVRRKPERREADAHGESSGDDASGAMVLESEVSEEE